MGRGWNRRHARNVAGPGSPPRGRYVVAARSARAAGCTGRQPRSPSEAESEATESLLR